MVTGFNYGTIQVLVVIVGAALFMKDSDYRGTHFDRTISHKVEHFTSPRAITAKT